MGLERQRYLRGLLILLAVSLILPPLSYGMDVELGWDANVEPDIAGYRIYYKAASSGAPYSGTGADQGPSPIEVPVESLADSSNPGYTITGLTVGEIYYLVVTAYDTEGLESAYSKEAAIPRIGSPIEGFCVTGSDYTSYTISGTSAAQADVEIFANGHSVGNTTADENGLWSATADFTSAGEGAIGLTVTSTGATSDAVQGIFDKTPPTVALSYEKPGPYRDADMVTVTATFTDAGSIAGTPQIAIDFAGDGSDVTATDMSGTGANKVWTYSMDVPGENDGIATIAIIAFDAAGNEVGAYSGETFTVDNTSPRVEYAKYVDGTHLKVVFSEDVAPSFATEPSNYAVYGLIIDSVSGEGSTFILTTGEMAEGVAYTVVVSSAVTDMAGNSLDPAQNSAQFPAIDFTFDADGNGRAIALEDGVLILRFLCGFSGDSLIQGAVALDCTRCNPPDIETYLAGGLPSLLDLDGNGATVVLQDGLLILRFLGGFTGNPLIRGVVASDCERCTAAELESYLRAFTP